MTVTINGTTGITNDGGYTGDGVVFADTTPANTLVTTTGGNVGIGVTPSAWDTYKALEIGRVGNYFAGYSGGTELTLGANAYYSTGWKYAVTGALATRYMTDNSGGHYWYTAPSGTAGNAISFTQAMTLDSSGNLLVGKTAVTSSVTGAYVSSGGILNITQPSTFSYANFFNSSGSLIGYIANSGNTTTVYSTTSDYRLKEDVQPMVDALASLQQLKPCTYKWKSNNACGQGFIAHELASVFPDAVIGEKDAVNEDGSIKPQGIDTSFLVATLTAAIQEQQAIILAQESALNALTARVAALEGTQP